MDVIEFNKFIGILKTIERSGWVRNKIPHPESVAEHSFRTGILAMILAKDMDVDQLKSIKMALIHDIGESIIGDIVTERADVKIAKNLVESKKLQEHDAIERIFSFLDEDGTEYVKLFDEFEEDKTPEAKFVKQLDKLEMAIQAYEYETKHKLNLEEFYVTARARIKEKKLITILKGLESMRKHKK